MMCEEATEKWMYARRLIIELIKINISMQSSLRYLHLGKKYGCSKFEIVSYSRYFTVLEIIKFFPSISFEKREK